MNAVKHKVIIVNEKLMDYRIPIYDILADKYDLTVAYSYPFKGEYGGKFKHLQLRTPRKAGPFFLHPDSVHNICEQFEVAIVLGEIRRLSLALLPFRKRKYKMAFWTIGVSTEHGFDECKRMDFARDYIYKKAEACIFYTDYARDRAIRKGYDPEATFVANNTVKVLPLEQNSKKESYLFIGTLRAGKGLSILLESYKKAYETNRDIPHLNIVGGGDEYAAIKKWIEDAGLTGKISLAGPVYDKEIKRGFFQRAHVCISPSQAGLSVLESMGYGVPFVTMHNAYTGGERLNIHDGVDGVLLKQEGDLVELLLDVATRPERYKEMGDRAHEYYWRERKPERMAQGLSDAIDYLLTLA